MVVATLLAKKCCRLPLLGESLDGCLQELITSMRQRGAPIGTTIIVGIGPGILMKHNKASLEEYGGSVKLNNEWAKSVLC